mgnify:CR=1 FL=1
MSDDSELKKIHVIEVRFNYIIMDVGQKDTTIRMAMAKLMSNSLNKNYGGKKTLRLSMFNSKSFEAQVFRSCLEIII